MKKVEITEKQAITYNLMLIALKQIAHDYQTPSQIRKGSKCEYGLDFDEAIEMAYENIQEVAKRVTKGVKSL
jgi:hypothetical protein